MRKRIKEGKGRRKNTVGVPQEPSTRQWSLSLPGWGCLWQTRRIIPASFALLDPFEHNTLHISTACASIHCSAPD